jgi:hypothetical protein
MWCKRFPGYFGFIVTKEAVAKCRPPLTVVYTISVGFYELPMLDSVHFLTIKKIHICFTNGLGEPLNLVELKTSSVILDITTLEVEPIIAYRFVEDDPTIEAKLSGSLTTPMINWSGVPDPWE